MLLNTVQEFFYFRMSVIAHQCSSVIHYSWYLLKKLQKREVKKLLETYFFMKHDIFGT